MKKWILLPTMILSLAYLSYGQARQWGYHAGAGLQISEANGVNVLSAGMTAGVSNGRLLLGFYGLKALNQAQTPTYQSTLEEYGLQGFYLYPLTPRLNFSFGLKAGYGKAGLEAVSGQISEGKQEENIRAASPEVGIEFPLSRNLSLAYSSGYRWVWGAEKLEDVSCGNFSSLYNALTLRVGFFPGR